MRKQAELDVDTLQDLANQHELGGFTSWGQMPGKYRRL